MFFVEVIVCVEILFEEVVFKYGYLVDQKVLNIVLCQCFKVVMVEFRDWFLMFGGVNQVDVQFGFLMVCCDYWLNFNVVYQQVDMLIEVQCGIIVEDGGVIGCSL